MIAVTLLAWTPTLFLASCMCEAGCSSEVIACNTVSSSCSYSHTAHYGEKGGHWWWKGGHLGCQSHSWWATELLSSPGWLLQLVACTSHWITQHCIHQRTLVTSSMLIRLQKSSPVSQRGSKLFLLGIRLHLCNWPCNFLTFMWMLNSTWCCWVCLHHSLLIFKI